MVNEHCRGTPSLRTSTWCLLWSVVLLAECSWWSVIRILKFVDALGLELKLKVVYLERWQLVSAQLGLYNMSFDLGSFFSVGLRWPCCSSQSNYLAGNYWGCCCLFTSKERGLGLAILPHFLVVLALRKILPPLLTVSEGDGRPACPSEHGLLRTCWVSNNLFYPSMLSCL